MFTKNCTGKQKEPYTKVQGNHKFLQENQMSDSNKYCSKLDKLMIVTDKKSFGISKRKKCNILF